MDQETPLPLSYLNQLAYCPRRFWYMYIRGELEINAPMLEGTFQHQTRADKPGHETDDRGYIIRRRLHIWSDRLHLIGFADLVQHDPHSNSLTPVEYKHGKQGKWDNDQIQLCAQALCLEEMTGQPVSQGEIFYWRSRRRMTIPFTPELRNQTEITIRQARTLIHQARYAPHAIPGPIAERPKCADCSLQPVCLPEEVIRLQSLLSA